MRRARLAATPPRSATRAATGIPFELALIRNHYVGRTFISPAQKVRDMSVRIKFNPVREVLEGKRVVVVDDSIVRGTTMRKLVKLLRAGRRAGGPPAHRLAAGHQPVLLRHRHAAAQAS